jgi:hypothetical protein
MSRIRPYRRSKQGRFGTVHCRRKLCSFSQFRSLNKLKLSVLSLKRRRLHCNSNCGRVDFIGESSRRFLLRIRALRLATVSFASSCKATSAACFRTSCRYGTIAITLLILFLSCNNPFSSHLVNVRIKALMAERSKTPRGNPRQTLDLLCQAMLLICVLTFASQFIFPPDDFTQLVRQD